MTGPDPADGTSASETTADVVARVLGVSLEPWQAELLEQVRLANPAPFDPVRAHAAARRALKAAFEREWVRAALAVGEHVHLLGVDGTECPGGFCTPEQLRPPQLEPDLSDLVDRFEDRVIFDEAWQLLPDLRPQHVDEAWTWSAANPLPEGLISKRSLDTDFYLTWSIRADVDEQP